MLGNSLTVIHRVKSVLLSAVTKVTDHSIEVEQHLPCMSIVYPMVLFITMHHYRSFINNKINVQPLATVPHANSPSKSEFSNVQYFMVLLLYAPLSELHQYQQQTYNHQQLYHMQIHHQRVSTVLFGVHLMVLAPSISMTDVQLPATVPHADSPSKSEYSIVWCSFNGVSSININDRCTITSNCTTCRFTIKE